MTDILRAMNFAKAKHEGQVRKHSYDPYIFHPMQVSNLLHYYTEDDSLMVAGLLHDVVEDTDTTIYEIEDEFGGWIAHLVNGVTDVSRPEDGNRATRKALDREHLSNGCYHIQTIKYADVLDNTKDITSWTHPKMRKFIPVYINEMRLLLDVIPAGHPKLYQMARDLVFNYTFEEEVK